MLALFAAKDYAGMRTALENDPSLANEGLPCFDGNGAKAHPLHRLCDGVFNKIYSDEEALEMARILLEFGADINGGEYGRKRDTPLIAASSLYAEKTAIFYIEQGADIFHAGTHGGTALHWASWVGCDKLVKKLIDEGAELEKRCVDFGGTPLLWTVHGFKHSRKRNHVECARLLLAAGADNTVKNIEGHALLEFLDEGDKEMISVLQK